MAMQPAVSQGRFAGPVVLTLISQLALAQEPVAWDKAAAQKEIDGMRRYAWVMSEGVAGTLEKSPADKFPGIHAFVRDFRDARKEVDSEKDPSEWKTIDVEALAIRNPNYWSAVYEVAPADPLMMWFHAALYAVNGQVARTRYSQLLALRSPLDSPWKKEMLRLIVSSERLITMGDQAVKNGVRLHDQEKYDEAAKVYRDVLSVIPSHSFALYELGYTSRMRDRGKEGRTVAQTYFDRARQVDPFRVEAYQGTFNRDEFQRMSALRSRAKPAWEKFLQTPLDQSTLSELEQLSSHLQAAGLYDLGLIVRQLVVARRENSFNEDDLGFIEAGLQGLMPQGDFDAILKRLGGQREELRINNLTLNK
jgi:tetratricopeptide (TPR) repeat protein